jgi:Tfp pilus assembly protein PilO
MLYIDSTTNRRFGLCVQCAGGLFVLAALVGMYKLQYAPTIDATRIAKAGIGAIQQSLHKAPAIHREYTGLSDQLQQMEQRLARIRRRVPRQSGESEFLETLARAAKEDGMVITNLSTSPPRQLSGYSQRDLTITGSATYESLCRFVKRIGSFPRLAKVVGLEVRTDSGGNGGYPVTITVAIYYDLIAGPSGKG